MTPLFSKTTPSEATLIAARIAPVFDAVLNEYDFLKYPAAHYQAFKTSYSARTAQNPQIADSLLWKWGHWGKPNYPQRHRNLIAEVEGLWPRFIGSGCAQAPDQTFQWWQAQFKRQTTYITSAYITHLVHHSAPLPIIDQHNFRAMNALFETVRPSQKRKKRPSSWNDIQVLKDFMSQVLVAMPQRSFSELDRFLMMYGRNHVPR
ncbi:hypothetical protein [Pseudomonas rhodesiae]|jgi:hypothetical protein|uniref:hypothetical protein n=1 Tax=Pseudomonas rhodesiae TaxID=76760 RepID=UPI00054B3B7C|nr:hypothetical protein [Pseudomonas rhodesiae]